MTSQVLSIKGRQLDKGLLSLLILYIKQQEELYINYMQGFKELTKLLELDGPEDFKHLPYMPSELGPNICGRCLEVYGLTVSGKLQDGCHKCFGKAFKDAVLRSYWLFGMAQDVLVGVSERQIDLHMCWALYILKQQKEKNGATESSTARHAKEIDRCETAIGRTRRFNFTGRRSQ